MNKSARRDFLLPLIPSIGRTMPPVKRQAPVDKDERKRVALASRMERAKRMEEEKSDMLTTLIDEAPEPTMVLERTIVFKLNKAQSGDDTVHHITWLPAYRGTNDMGYTEMIDKDVRGVHVSGHYTSIAMTPCLELRNICRGKLVYIRFFDKVSRTILCVHGYADVSLPYMMIKDACDKDGKNYICKLGSVKEVIVNGTRHFIVGLGVKTPK